MNLVNELLLCEFFSPRNNFLLHCVTFDKAKFEIDEFILLCNLIEKMHFVPFYCFIA